MHEVMENSAILNLTTPKSVVFYGASDKFGMGSVILTQLKALGFEGDIYLVHPKQTEVMGHRAWPSVSDLPETPDLAVVVLPAGLVGPTLDECGRKGVKSAIVVSGGFKETGPEGAAMEAELREIVRGHGMRMVGPNCLGVLNTHHKFSTNTLPYVGSPGYIGLVSQSGSFVTQMFGPLAQRDLGFSTAFSVGNEADVDLVDCLEYLGECPHTRVIAMYIEGIRRGREFVETARRVSAKKPIVAYYVGGSETGGRAGLSHTGAMAGPDRLYDGIFRQAGVIRAETIEEVFDFCQVLGSLPVPNGNRVVVLTDSGGPGAAAADACGRAGLDLPSLDPGTKERMADVFPVTGSLNNPVDLTFHRVPTAYVDEIPKAILADENADMLLMYLLAPVEVIAEAFRAMGMEHDEATAAAAKMNEDQAEAVSALSEKGKPVLGYTLRSLTDEPIKTMMKKGVIVLPGTRRPARALMALLTCRAYREKASARAGG
jgi:acetyl-CoA synthetase (ADP-forming)